jgi:hypothetical protein
VPQVVNLDHPDLVVVADATEGPAQIPGLDGTAAAGGEHESGVLPGAAECLSIVGLLLLANEQRHASQAGDGQVAGPGVGLDRAGSQAAVDALERLPDGERACLQVDVCQRRPRASPRRMPYKIRSTKAG